MWTLNETMNVLFLICILVIIFYVLVGILFVQDEEEVSPFGRFMMLASSVLMIFVIIFGLLFITKLSHCIFRDTRI